MFEISLSLLSYARPRDLTVVSQDAIKDEVNDSSSRLLILSRKLWLKFRIFFATIIWYHIELEILALEPLCMFSQ